MSMIVETAAMAAYYERLGVGDAEGAAAVTLTATERAAVVRTVAHVRRARRGYLGRPCLCGAGPVIGERGAAPACAACGADWYPPRRR